MFWENSLKDILFAHSIRMNLEWCNVIDVLTEASGQPHIFLQCETQIGKSASGPEFGSSEADTISSLLLCWVIPHLWNTCSLQGWRKWILPEERFRSGVSARWEGCFNYRCILFILNVDTHWHGCSHTHPHARMQAHLHIVWRKPKQNCHCLYA